MNSYVIKKAKRLSTMTVEELAKAEVSCKDCSRYSEGWCKNTGPKSDIEPCGYFKFKPTMKTTLGEYAEIVKDGRYFIVKIHKQDETEESYFLNPFEARVQLREIERWLCGRAVKAHKEKSDSIECYLNPEL